MTTCQRGETENALIRSWVGDRADDSCNGIILFDIHNDNKPNSVPNAGNATKGDFFLVLSTGALLANVLLLEEEGESVQELLSSLQPDKVHFSTPNDDDDDDDDDYKSENLCHNWNSSPLLISALNAKCKLQCYCSPHQGDEKDDNRVHNPGFQGWEFNIIAENEAFLQWLCR